MKRNILLLFAIFYVCLAINAQDYVTPKKGVVWGANEKLYADYGKKALAAMNNDSYNLAIDYLEKMTKITAKNVIRRTDYFFLCKCYMKIWDMERYIVASKNYIQIVGDPKNRADSLDLNNVLTFQGLAYFETSQYRDGLVSLEKSNSYKLTMENYDLMSRCYKGLGNIDLAKKNRIIAIALEARNNNLTIIDIETKGVDNPFLGQMFYNYRELLPKNDSSYHDFIYLSFLAAKCNLPEAVNEFGYMLENPELVPVKNHKLFMLDK